MFLSDQAIKKALKAKKIIISPQVKDADIRAVGIRVYLADQILVPIKGQTIDLAKPGELRYKKVDLTKTKFILKPGQFILGALTQHFSISRDLLAFIDGRSTLARLGLTIHQTSTTVDAQYEEPRNVTLEIVNTGNFNIKLVGNYPIAMLLFAKLEGMVAQRTQTQYKHQKHATPANLKFKTGQDS